jgi:hypothetical protein
MVSGEATALRQKDLLGGHHITSCPIQLYHKRSWIPAFFNLIFDRNFHYYEYLIISRKCINQKGEEFCIQVVVVVSHLHPAARQFCRSTYTIKDITIK